MFVHLFFFFKQKTAYEIMPSLVGSEMCIRDRLRTTRALLGSICLRLSIAFSALYSCQNEKAAFMNMTRKHAIPSGTLFEMIAITPVSYTHLRAHETRHDLVCRLLLEKKKKNKKKKQK